MKKILDVGNCAPDHAALVQFLKQNFSCDVSQANQADDAIATLQDSPFDLVLVNRKLDIDYTDGLEVIKKIKANSATQTIPVMLITNFPEHQEAAEAVGAVRGFGKLEYNKPETLERVRLALEV